MIKRWKEVLSNLKNEDIPYFLIIDLLLIYFLIYFTIKFLKIFRKSIDTLPNLCYNTIENKEKR